MDHKQLATVSSTDELTSSPSAHPAVTDTVPAAYWQPKFSDDDPIVSPRLILRTLAQWWYIALPIGGLLAICSAAAVMLNFEPVYRSTAVLKIASYTPYIAYTSADQPMDPEEFTQTQIELLRSGLVMEQVLGSQEVTDLPEISGKENPAGWLAGCVRVSQVGTSELYNVHFDGPNPTNAALLVNTILDEYFAIRAQDAESKTKKVLELLAQEKELRGLEISRLREKMRKLGKNVVGTDPITGMPSSDAKRTLAPVIELGDRLVAIEMDRKVLEMEIAAVRETLSRKVVSVPDAQLEVAVSDSFEVQNLRSLIASKKAMLHRIESAAAAGTDDPSYKRLEREIAGYERSLTNSVTASRPMIKEQLQQMAALESKDLLTQLEAQLESKKVLEDLLRERYKEQLASASESGNQLLDLEFTRSELAREENVFEMIAERSMALTTEMRAPGRVSLLQAGEVPRKPLETIPLKTLALVILASGCFPFALALLWEVSVRRIANAEQLSSQADLPVVSEVAKLPGRLRLITPGGAKARNLFQESIDSLRVGLILPDEFSNVRVIAVTSATHDEGKSSISSQLAVSLGRSASGPVLLIDGDLRAPDVHRIFNIPNKPGLASVLDGTATLEEAINTTRSDHIHLLPAGRLRKHPHKLMSIESLTELLEELRPFYDYIIFDTPPVLSASEALMLTKVADGTLLSTRRNVSRESQVRNAYARLLKAGARPMGAVFNGVPTRSYVQTYGSYEYARRFE